jgi:hypothetical protein
MMHGMDSTFGSDRGPANAPWWWRREDAAGAPVPRGDGAADQPRFTSQSDAETWIGEVWRDLLEEGVEQVVLLEGDREVYGPMSLRPAGG